MMLKIAFLASAMTIAVPVAAQTAQTAPAALQQTAPATQTTPAAPATATDPMQAQPATPATPADPAATAAQPAASGDQVAQVVNTEFPTYDKNSDGNLSKTEFASWMTALKAADPSAKKDAAADKKWNDAAFAQADADKSKSVSKDELTGFLSKGTQAS
ncbi:Calcium-binding protein [Sphingomonas sp. EC-HK361]|uniref:EF-hand domain-containing protein n=1 Tax=Sphingomonas sp. EC-HK361 TaxID=2038397 RepID=UPI0012598EA5|nr:EF-hand domain-containing protein [Sphingomonas sp. EC-HK361]VVT16458.1 Calcium-binding protein [Sphingomonas sp. EC-HK361]